MHARIVRFTGVGRDRVDGLVREIEESEGPPPGVESTGIQLFYDADQETAVVLAHFADEEKMRAADQAFEEMDPSDTPGSRASVDRCELKLDRQM
jgi:hypothetical protein